MSADDGANRHITIYRVLETGCELESSRLPRSEGESMLLVDRREKKSITSDLYQAMLTGAFSDLNWHHP